MRCRRINPRNIPNAMPIVALWAASRVHSPQTRSNSCGRSHHLMRSVLWRGNAVCSQLDSENAHLEGYNHVSSLSPPWMAPRSLARIPRLTWLKLTQRGFQRAMHRFQAILLAVASATRVPAHHHRRSYGPAIRPPPPSACVSRGDLFGDGLVDGVTAGERRMPNRWVRWEGA